MRISDWSSDVCSSDLQQAGAAKLERQARLRDEIFGDQTDRRQIGRTEHGDAGQHEIEIGGGILARANAGDEAVLLPEIVGGLFGIEDDRDVEEAEEDDARGVTRHVDRLSVREIMVERNQEIACRGVALKDRKRGEWG